MTDGKAPITIGFAAMLAVEYMKSLVEAGFIDRLMFGSENFDLSKIIPAINELDFLFEEQKEKIF